MALWIVRTAFVVAAGGVGLTIARSLAMQDDVWDGLPWVVFLAIVLGAFGIIAVDVLTPRKRIETITCVYFGIVIGLFLSYLASISLEPLLLDPNMAPTVYKSRIQLVLGVTLCYLCVSVLMQTRDDFRFIIPYVEFSKEVKGLQPYVLDTSVVIDGRIADLVETGVLDNQLIMPRFVLNELQNIADSSDKMRRTRGRRGLDILNRLRTNDNVELKIHDREWPDMLDQPVDMKLVLLAGHLDGKLVTGDYNLNKVAKLHTVPVINLNDIANALKPVFLPGESVQVKIVKAGEETGQGVGYLDDGTMIVIEGGSDHVRETVFISVTSVLQTSAGRMIFGKFNSLDETSG